jgi:hypothetical protein
MRMRIAPACCLRHEVRIDDDLDRVPVEDLRHALLELLLHDDGRNAVLLGLETPLPLVQRAHLEEVARGVDVVHTAAGERVAWPPVECNREVRHSRTARVIEQPADGDVRACGVCEPAADRMLDVDRARQCFERGDPLACGSRA